MSTVETLNGHTPFDVIAGNDAPLAEVDADTLRQMIEACGALILRGFRMSLEGFEQLGAGLCSASVFNESPNRELLGTESLMQSVNIGSDPFPLHPELAREPWRPDLAMFACLDPPGVGGQTNICDGIAIADNLPDDLRDYLNDKQLYYVRPASPQMLRYWLGTEAPDDALLQSPPPSCPYWFRRSPRGMLRGFVRPVLEPTLFQDRPAFANFLLFARDYLRITHVPLLNGLTFPDELVDRIRSVARSLTYSHRWQQGDVVVLDNSRFMHGRKAIVNPKERRIATYFGYLKGIDRREGEPPDPIWRRERFVPPETPDDMRS